MPSDMRECRPAQPQVSAAAAGGGARLHHPPPSPQAEALPCLHCDSTNTSPSLATFASPAAATGPRAAPSATSPLAVAPASRWRQRSASTSSKRPRSLAPPPSSSPSCSSSL
ncbi:hypothetical protein NL676_022682 [Syzygium grande]|nr:hypothetical protein NL676_022682 [Syzygium grande]